MQLQNTQNRLRPNDTIVWRDVPHRSRRLVRRAPVATETRPPSAGAEVAVPLALMTMAAAAFVARATLGAGGDAAALAAGAFALNVAIGVALSAAAVWIASGVFDCMDERLGPALAKLAAIHTVLAMCLSFGIFGVLVAGLALLALLQWLFDLDTVESVVTTLVVALTHVVAMVVTLVLLPQAEGLVPLLTGLV